MHVVNSYGAVRMLLLLVQAPTEMSYASGVCLPPLLQVLRVRRTLVASSICHLYYPADIICSTTPTQRYINVHVRKSADRAGERADGPTRRRVTDLSWLKTLMLG